MPAAKVRALCTSQGASPMGVACSWVSEGTCYILFYQATNRNPFRLIADTKRPIAIVGRRIIPAESLAEGRANAVR